MSVVERIPASCTAAGKANYRLEGDNRQAGQSLENLPELIPLLSLVYRSRGIK